MKNISLINRIRIISIGTITVFAIFILFYLLPLQSRHVENQVELKLQNLVESQIKTLEYYHDRFVQGELSEEVAQAEALKLIEIARYNEDVDYFWVNDEQANVIMHPINPALNNTNQSEMADEDGVRIFSEFARVAQDGRNGFVRYRWPKTPGDSPEPKLSYVEGFSPWGYIVGTGIWIDDLDALKNSVRNTSLIVLTALILLVTAFVTLIQRVMKKTLKEITTKSEAYSNYDYRNRILVDSKDELGKIATSFNHSVDNLREMVSEMTQFNQTLSNNSSTLTGLTDTLLENAEETTSVSDDINDIIQHTTSATKEMADRVEEVRDAVESIATRATEGAMTTHDVAARASQLEQDALSATERANNLYNEAKEQMTHAIEDSKSVSEIDTLANKIIAITGKTKLLALNASIEAARAGEAGRGFSVVADEIGLLAMQSTETADHIQRIVEIVTGSVSKLAESSNALLEFIDAQVLADYKKLQNTSSQYTQDADTFNTIMMDLSAASQELNASMDAILSTINDLSESAQKGSHGVTKIRDMNESLSNDAERVTQINQEMKAIVDRFTQLISKIKY